jgi:glycosyltransferase involved in cell wall biosynthesis
MGFASAYLEKRALFPAITGEEPDKHTGIIVVIPAYNEPGICKLLDSLVQCGEPDCKAEVIIVVNAPGDATEESKANNLLTLKNIESWKIKHNSCFFRLFAFNTEPSVPGWGVGLARKTGMDEAVRRFDHINNPDGVIVCLDADCTVQSNYFESLCNQLYRIKCRSACSIYFEHPLSGNEFEESNYRFISLYELHLRYYYQGLAISGFPYVFHTVGSSMAVKALSYIKAGGMNRRQAGEDFYFIQKLVPEEGYFNLISTTIFPSPRVSTRVPFGTGASIGKMTEGGIHTFLTYNLLAFEELSRLFSMTEEFYKSDPLEIPGFYTLFPLGLRLFIDEAEWKSKMTEIKNNTSGLKSFRKRFYGWFNMFMIVKYLNQVHLSVYEKKPVTESAADLLELIGKSCLNKNPEYLLNVFRLLEKNG